MGMNRRSFVSLTGTGAALFRGEATRAGGVAPGAEGRSRSGKPVKMHVGTQQGPTTPGMLQYLKRLEVNHICGYPPDPGTRGSWTSDDLQRTHVLCEKHGVALDMVALPFLSSSHIDQESHGAIMLGKSADRDRDRDIDHIQKTIAACARAGIPAFKYNMSLLGVLRTGTTPGRVGSRYSTWRLADAREDPPLTRAGKVTADVAWERITSFLERVIPVCNEYKVRAACHPHGPGVPSRGFQGIVRVLGTLRDSASSSRSRRARTTGSICALGRPRRCFKTRAGRSMTSSASSAGARRSSTFTFAISGANATTSRKFTPTRATWTCSRLR